LKPTSTLAASLWDAVRGELKMGSGVSGARDGAAGPRRRASDYEMASEPDRVAIIGPQAGR